MIEILLDPTNLGEVLACLGLFEIAELSCPSFGSFEEVKRGVVKFVLETEINLQEVLEKLKKVRIRSQPHPSLEKRKYPVVVEFVDGKIVLDWWLDPLWRERKTLLKIWGGKKHLYVEGSTKESYLLEYLEKIDVERALKDPFYRDPLVSLGFDVSGSWDRSSAGYSYDDVGQPPYVSPLCEFLSAIALRSFQPRENISERFLEYYLWAEKLPHNVARLAFVGSWIGRPFSYRGPWKVDVKEKGQGYKRLTKAQHF